MTDLNLYQIIGVSETASLAEIELAAGSKYNEARNLVNHHSPEIANNATQTLNMLEKVRTVLLNPTKRAEYDKSLGLVGSIGGLADPTQVLNKFSTSFGAPAGTMLNRQQQQMQPQQPQQPAMMDTLVGLNAWICGKCNTPNSKGTKFCKKCGNAVGIICPNCGKLIEASAERCTECGVSIKEVIKRSEIEREMNAQQIREQMKLQPILAQMQKNSSSAMSLASFWWILFAWLAIILWIVAYGKAVNVLNMEGIDNPAAAPYRDTAMRARRRAKSNLIFAVIIIVIAVVIAIINNANY